MVPTRNPQYYWPQNHELGGSALNIYNKDKLHFINNIMRLLNIGGEHRSPQVVHNWKPLPVISKTNLYVEFHQVPFAECHEDKSINLLFLERGRVPEPPGGHPPLDIAHIPIVDFFLTPSLVLHAQGQEARPILRYIVKDTYLAATTEILAENMLIRSRAASYLLRNYFPGSKLTTIYSI